MGAGHWVLDPSPAVVSPLLWMSASPITVERSGWELDFSAAPVVAGEETVDQAGERLLRYVLDVASGTYAKSETVRYADPVQIYLRDPAF